MTDLRQRMTEDRHLRDSAKALVKADIAHLKSELAAKGIGERAMDRVKGGAADVYDEAVEVAGNNKGVLAALVSAILIWFARNPILSSLGFSDEPDDEDDHYDEPRERRSFFGRLWNERK